MFQAFSFLMYSSVIHIAKDKTQDWCLKNEKHSVSNPLFRSACLPSPLLMEQFKPIRCLVVECAVGALSVIKFYIGINAFHELTLGVILVPINLPRFMEAKKDSATALSWGWPGFKKDVFHVYSSQDTM